MTKFCTYCGTENNSNAKLCSSCGMEFTKKILNNDIIKLSFAVSSKFNYKF